MMTNKNSKGNSTQERLLKLAEYESTGLSPQEVSCLVNERDEARRLFKELALTVATLLENYDDCGDITDDEEQELKSLFETFPWSS